MRRYAWELGSSSLRASNSGTSAGALWLFLEPVFSITVYWLVFGVLLDVSRGVDNFLAFLVAGQITFGLSQRALLGASAALTLQAPMLRALSFPRTVLPLSAVFKSLAAYRTELVVMAVVLTMIGETPRFAWLFILPIAVLQATTSLGIGMGLARLVHRFGDVQRLLTHLMRLAFYASGVFFPLGAFTDSELVLRGATLNPFYNQVELARWALIDTKPNTPTLTVVMAVLWMIAGLVGGAVFFVRGEDGYASRVVRL